MIVLGAILAMMVVIPVLLIVHERLTVRQPIALSNPLDTALSVRNGPIVVSTRPHRWTVIKPEKLSD